MDETPFWVVPKDRNKTAAYLSQCSLDHASGLFMPALLLFNNLECPTQGSSSSRSFWHTISNAAYFYFAEGSPTNGLATIHSHIRADTNAMSPHTSGVPGGVLRASLRTEGKAEETTTSHRRRQLTVYGRDSLNGSLVKSLTSFLPTQTRAPSTFVSRTSCYKMIIPEPLQNVQEKSKRLLTNASVSICGIVT